MHPSRKCLSFFFSSLTQVKWKLKAVLICISMRSKDTEQLKKMFLSHLYISFGELFLVSCSVWQWALCFLQFISLSSLYIIDTNLRTCTAGKYFSHFLDCLVIQTMVSFVVWEPFSLRSHLLIVHFSALNCLSLVQTILPCAHEFKHIPYSFIWFRESGVMLRSLIHLGLSFVQDER